MKHHLPPALNEAPNGTSQRIRGLLTGGSVPDGAVRCEDYTRRQWCSLEIHKRPANRGFGPETVNDFALVENPSRASELNEILGQQRVKFGGGLPYFRLEQPFFQL
jgi:hypothetical protein